MNTIRKLATCAALALLTGVAAAAQEKPKPEPKPITPLKVQVIISEYEGEKKIVSLPYTLLVNADEPEGRDNTSLRMGIKVPIVTVQKDGKETTQYMDVGTDIDCGARAAGGGQFRLRLNLRRNSLYASAPASKPMEGTPGIRAAEANPILSESSQFVNLLMRDGQTVQSTMATDPFSGRVVKVDVTLTVVKM